MGRKKTEKSNNVVGNILSVNPGTEVHSGPSNLGGNTYLGRNSETLTGRVLSTSQWRPRGISDVAMQLVDNPRYPKDPHFEVGHQYWFRRRPPTKGNKDGSWI